MHVEGLSLKNFRRFFVRGLTVVLPSVLTIAIILYAYQFVQDMIAGPINGAVRETLIHATYYPHVEPEELEVAKKAMREGTHLEIKKRAAGDTKEEARLFLLEARRMKLNTKWRDWGYLLDLIGVIIAVIAIYILGGLISNYLGRSLVHSSEKFIKQLPLLKHVYPSVKQVTDFFFGDDDGAEKMKFNRVVAVQYPRKGLWSIGLVTGETLKEISEKTGQNCITIFIPSSPTPFTGYVITAVQEDTIDLDLSIDEALRFTVSGGVIVPDGRSMEGIQAVNQSAEPIQTVKNEGVKTIVVPDGTDTGSP